jgi:hypothetical protein
VLKPSAADFRQACGRRRWKEPAWPMIAAIAQQGLALLPYHRANMIDLNQILAGMAAAIQTSDFPNACEMAASLGLDLSTATVTVTRSGAIAIIGARFPALPTAEVEVAGAARPRKLIATSRMLERLEADPYFQVENLNDLDARIPIILWCYACARPTGREKCKSSRARIT